MDHYGNALGMKGSIFFSCILNMFFCRTIYNFLFNLLERIFFLMARGTGL